MSESSVSAFRFSDEEGAADRIAAAMRPEVRDVAIRMNPEFGCQEAGTRQTPDDAHRTTSVARLDRHDGGRAVHSLDYSAHPTAGKVVAEVAADIAARAQGVRAIALSHRVGPLGIVAKGPSWYLVATTDFQAKIAPG